MLEDPACCACIDIFSGSGSLPTDTVPTKSLKLISKTGVVSTGTETIGGSRALVFTVIGAQLAVTETLLFTGIVEAVL